MGYYGPVLIVMRAFKESPSHTRKHTHTDCTRTHACQHTTHVGRIGIHTCMQVPRCPTPEGEAPAPQRKLHLNLASFDALTLRQLQLLVHKCESGAPQQPQQERQLKEGEAGQEQGGVLQQGQGQEQGPKQEGEEQGGRQQQRPLPQQEQRQAGGEGGLGAMGACGPNLDKSTGAEQASSGMGPPSCADSGAACGAGAAAPGAGAGGGAPAAALGAGAAAGPRALPLPAAAAGAAAERCIPDVLAAGLGGSEGLGRGRVAGAGAGVPAASTGGVQQRGGARSQHAPSLSAQAGILWPGAQAGGCACAPVCMCMLPTDVPGHVLVALGGTRGMQQ